LTTRIQKIHALLTTAIAAALFAILGGCSLFPTGPKAFRHADHSARGITCDACHNASTADGVASMPSYGICQACHGATEARASYAYEQEIQTKAPALAFEAAPRYDDLKFSHAAHLARGIECSACHGGIASAGVRIPSASVAVAPETCASCHARSGVADDCAICHKERRRDVPPPTHRNTWIRLHGREVSHGMPRGHTESCELCHSRGDCDSCHQVEKPLSHTEFFRQRGHGLQVEIERETCTVCHQETFCVRCHQETQPRDHFSGAWGGSQSNHCISCHEPIRDARCFVCHRSTPSHLQATRIPPPPHPNATANCYQCHLRPPHADNHMPCVECHR